jgi:hypothetical protein
MYDLHLTSDDFYALTPRQFDALCKRKRIELAQYEFMSAQITSWIANTGFKSVEKPTTARDFMPSEWAKKKTSASTSTPPKRMTKKRRKAVAAGIRAMFPNLHPKKD